MLEIVATKPFKKDLKKYQYKKDIIKELYDVISMLAKEEPLESSKKDHNLVGNYVNYRESHVRNGLLLIYKVEKKDLQPLPSKVWISFGSLLT